MSPLSPSKVHPLASARRRSTLRLAATAAVVAATGAITACGRAAPTEPTRLAAPHHVRGDQTTIDTTRTDTTGVRVVGIYENPMV